MDPNIHRHEQKNSAKLSETFNKAVQTVHCERVDCGREFRSVVMAGQPLRTLCPECEKAVADHMAKLRGKKKALDAAGELILKDRTCSNCGATTQSYFEHAHVLCDACRDSKYVEHESTLHPSDRMLALARQAEFKSICPREYYDTFHVKKLMKERHVQAHVIEQVLNWQPGPKGLFLWGETRMGKTRMMWELVRRLYVAGHNVECRDVRLGNQISGLFFDNPKQAEADMQRLRECKILFIDELIPKGSKFTPKHEDELFKLLEYRLANKLPLLATANWHGDGVAEKSNDRFGTGQPIVERIREMCTTIQSPGKSAVPATSRKKKSVS